MVFFNKEIEEIVQAKNKKEALKRLDSLYNDYHLSSIKRKFSLKRPFHLQIRYHCMVKIPVETEKDMLIKKLDKALTERRKKEESKEKIIYIEKEVEQKRNEQLTEVEQKHLNYLVSKGVSESTCKQWMEEWRAQKELDLMPFLIEKMQVVLKSIKFDTKNKKMAFFGPTGVGKSTTLVKLINKNKTLITNVITNDDKRMGAFAEMEAYATKYNFEVKKSTFKDVNINEGFKRKNPDRVFIDTPGMNPKNKSKRKEMMDYYETINLDIKTLVIAATQKTSDMIKTVNLYKNLGIDNIIITKMDETEEHAFILDLQKETGIPVSYIANGQRPTSYIKEFDIESYIQYIWRDFDHVYFSDKKKQISEANSNNKKI